MTSPTMLKSPVRTVTAAPTVCAAAGVPNEPLSRTTSLVAPTPIDLISAYSEPIFRTSLVLTEETPVASLAIVVVADPIEFLRSTLRDLNLSGV